MTNYVKPLVYNPKVAEKRIAELEAKVDKQMWSIMRLKEENTNLRLELDKYEDLVQVIHTQQKTINTYGKIFQMQEAELKKLRGETT